MGERKCKDAGIRNSYLHLILSSNDEWVVPAGKEARRFVVLRVSDAKKCDAEHFSTILDDMTKRGGDADLLHHLANVDLSGFDPRKIPHTQALLDNKLRSASAVVRFWHELLVKGANDGEETAWEGRIPLGQLVEYFNRHGGGRRTQARVAEGTFVKELSTVVDLTESTAYIYSAPTKVITVPTLDVCREQFAKAFDTPGMPWPSQQDEE